MRKTILTAAILATVFVGCKDQNKSETAVETEAVHEHVEDATHEDHEHDVFALDNSWVNEIEIDNGNKWDANIETTVGVNNRSEERRVGKECRSRWSAYH